MPCFRNKAFSPTILLKMGGGGGGGGGTEIRGLGQKGRGTGERVGVTKNAAEIDAPYPIYRRRKKNSISPSFPNGEGEKSQYHIFSKPAGAQGLKREGGRKGERKSAAFLNLPRTFSHKKVSPPLSFLFEIPSGRKCFLLLPRGERPKFIFIRLKAWYSSMHQRNLSKINYPFCCYVQLSNFTIECSLFRPKVCLTEAQRAESEKYQFVKGGRMGKKVGRQYYICLRGWA